MSGNGIDKLLFDQTPDFNMIYIAKKIMKDTGIVHPLSVLDKYEKIKSCCYIFILLYGSGAASINFRV